MRLACACLPFVPVSLPRHYSTRHRHDTTKLKNVALFLCLSPISTMSILTRKGKGRSGFVPSPHHHPYCRQARQAGRQAGCADLSPRPFGPSRCYFTICALRFASPGRNVVPISPLPTCRPRPEAPTTMMRSQASQNTAPKDRFCFIYLLAGRRVPETRPSSP